ncbi:TPA: hypothetical protein ACXIC2_000067 [Stenotrophomonas maltophilia]
MSVFMVKRLYRRGDCDFTAAEANVFVRTTCGGLHLVRKLKGKVGHEQESNYIFNADVPAGQVVVDAAPEVRVDVVRLS